MMQCDDLPRGAGRREGLLEPCSLFRVPWVVRVQADEQHVADGLRPPAAGHAQCLHLRATVTLLDIVVAQDGEQPRPFSQDGGQGLKDRGVEPGWIAVGVDVVAEQEHVIEGFGGTERGHGLCSELEAPSGVTDIAGYRKMEVVARRQRLEL